MKHVGVNSLVRTLAAFTPPSAGSHVEWVELGTVQLDMAILLDRFSVPISKGQYLLARSLTLPDPIEDTLPGSAPGPYDGAPSHTHAIPRPPQLAPIKPGDRVVCVWAAGGSILVVLDVVVTS